MKTMRSLELFFGKEMVNINDGYWTVRKFVLAVTKDKNMQNIP